MAAEVLESLARLQEKFGGTPYEMLVDDLVAAMAADTTVADLRQEVEFLKAERNLGALGCLVQALLDERGARLSPRLAAALEQAEDTLRRGPSVTFAEAVHEIRAELVALQNAPHEEHDGPVCPICVLTNRMLAALEAQRDD